MISRNKEKMNFLKVLLEKYIIKVILKFTSHNYNTGEIAGYVKGEKHEFLL